MQLLNERETSAKLSISIAMLRKWRRSETGPAFVKIGKRSIRYREDILDKFIQDGEVKREA